MFMMLGTAEKAGSGVDKIRVLTLWMENTDGGKLNKPMVESLKVDSGKLVKKAERISYAVLADKICEYCEEWRSISEISEYTGRNVKYLINKIIPRMLAEDKLEKLFPSKPTNPNQRYRVKGNAKVES
jgi:hypothetical protein